MTAALLESIGCELGLSDFVVGAFWLGETAIFACGDGVVSAFDGAGAALWRTENVNEGALLTAAPGFQDDVLTAGEDGRLVSVAADGRAATLAHAKGAWIEAIAASRAAKLAAFGAGKDAVIVGAEGELHRFSHEATVTGLAFEANGRRIAAAHYGGATLSWAASPASRRKTLEWKGAHLSALWSKDSRFLVTTMQENALHGWRLQDGQHFRMAGYPAKIRSLSWSHDQKWLATGGADEVVLWPFAGANGPMGTNAAVAGELPAACAAVACHPARPVLAAGDDKGEIALMPIGPGAPILIAEPQGARVTALAWSADGRRLAFGCESGRAGIVDFSDALE